MATKPQDPALKACPRRWEPTRAKHIRPCALPALLACNEAGCGPDKGRVCNLEVWSQYGQRIAPVYRKWKRPTHAQLENKFGALHAKMFAIGPKLVDAEAEDSKVVVLGSTNWTISSEANMELDAILEVGKDGTATMDAVLTEMKTAGSRLKSSSLKYSRR